MSGRVMDGRAVGQNIRNRIREQVKALANSKIQPNLVTILVGDSPASNVYLKRKHAACMEVGIRSRNIELRTQISQKELEDTIQRLNEDETVTGILLQLPLPQGFDDVRAVSRIAPEKDVDGLHPSNLGLLFQKTSKSKRLIPCTPKGIMVLLQYYRVQISGKQAVIVNRSKLVGRPLSQLLLNQDATVTVCHSKTQDLSEICKQADILVTGIGHRSEFAVGATMIKRGAAVVDVGTSSVDGKLMGDVDFESAMSVAAYVSPVPGGVGPMTIGMLLYNTLLTACIQKNATLDFNPDELGSPESL